jgi:hypothetical protein
MGSTLANSAYAALRQRRITQIACGQLRIRRKRYTTYVF